MQTLTPSYRLADNDKLVGEGAQQYVLRVKDLPDSDRPREKLLELGVQHLSNAELLALKITVVRQSPASTIRITWQKSAIYRLPRPVK
jgi:hypothetical protein